MLTCFYNHQALINHISKMYQYMHKSSGTHQKYQINNNKNIIRHISDIIDLHLHHHTYYPAFKHILRPQQKHHQPHQQLHCDTHYQMHHQNIKTCHQIHHQTHEQTHHQPVTHIISCIHIHKILRANY